MDPADPSKGANYSQLVVALQNIVASGFTPHIITGNVPVALSANPTIGGFGFNSQPPQNLSAYSAYLGGLAQAAVEAMGLDVVRTFRWGVYTEFNNYDWFVGPENAFFSLYDWTVCGLERVLGAGEAFVGAHACTQCDNYPHSARRGVGGSEPQWDPLDFLTHVAQGVNNCTGGVGAPLSYLSNSFYETNPEVPGDLSWFLPNMLPLLERAAELGLHDVEFGVDEGRILFGPVWEGEAIPILTRSVGDSYQASWDALLFKLMAYHNISYYSRWSVNTDDFEGLWSFNTTAVDNAATNLAQLTHRLVGGALLPVVNSSSGAPPAPSAPPPIVDAVAVLQPLSPPQLQVLAIHHHPWLNWTAPANVTVRACGTASQLPAPGARVAGVQWLIDDDHANFWPTWWADRAASNLTAYNSGWSQYGESISWDNATQAALFAARRPVYQQLARLASSDVYGTVVAGPCLVYSLALQPHSVALVEWAL